MSLHRLIVIIAWLAVIIGSASHTKSESLQEVASARGDGCVCTEQYQPVCGCDTNGLTTYGNPCFFGCASKMNSCLKYVCNYACDDKDCISPYPNSPCKI